MSYQYKIIDLRSPGIILHIIFSFSNQLACISEILSGVIVNLAERWNQEDSCNRIYNVARGTRLHKTNVVLEQC